MIEFVRRARAVDVERAPADESAGPTDRTIDDGPDRLGPHQIDTHLEELRAGTWQCGGCSVRVAARRSYRRADGTRVLAHFATWPTADGSTPHEAGCPFEPRERGGADAAGAPVDQLSSQAPANQGVAAWNARWQARDREWVLQLPAADVVAGTPARLPAAAPVRGSGEQTADHRSTARQAPALAPTGGGGTLASVRDVLELVRHFGRHPLDLPRFTARWGSGEQMRWLSWGDLYFPPGRHHLLVSRAVSHDLPPHPVAVAGVVAHVTARSNRRHGGTDTVIYLDLPDALVRQHRLVARITPGAASAPSQLPTADTVAGGAAVLLVARLESFTPAAAPGTPPGDRPTYCTAWIDHPAQLLVLDDDESFD